MDQKERSKVFKQFNQVKSGILFCTDIASRGLDFSFLRFIVLFDVSPSYRDYINRVGRTGRIEKKGVALSFLYEEELKYA